MSLNKQQQKFNKIIFHVNDTVNPKISELSCTPTIYLVNIVHLQNKIYFEIIHKTRQFESPMISLFLSYTCLDKNVLKMCLPLI